MAKPKRIIALVKWFDASYQLGECTQDELVPRVELVSAGLLVREDANTISLALDYDVTGNTWRHVAHIPKVNITSIQRFVYRKTKKGKSRNASAYK